MKDQVLRELQESVAALDAELEAAMEEFREEGRERPVRDVKPVDRLQPTTVPGEFNKGQTYAEVAARGAVNTKAVYGKREMRQGARQIVRKQHPNASEKQKKALCHLLTQGLKADMECDQAEAIVLARTMICFVQTYLLKAGIKKFGQRGKDAASTEMNQLHERNCFEPVDVKSLSDEERKRALESLIFLTKKRDGRIKARACANGSKQREWMSREESSSPMVSLPAVVLTSVMDAHEGREVAVIDIPNAFVQTENSGVMVFMKLGESQQ